MFRQLKLLFGLLLVTGVILIAGCNQNTSVQNTTPENTSPIEAGTTDEATTPPDESEEIDSVTEQVTESAGAELDDTESDLESSQDELAVLMVDESRVLEESSSFFIRRDDHLYTLSYRILSTTSGVDYSGIGKAVYSGTAPREFYSFVYEDNCFYVSYGDVPVPTLEENDLIVGYAATGGVPNMFLQKINFYGYGLCIYEIQNAVVIWTSNSSETIQIFRGNIDNIHVLDKDGNEVDDYRNLTRGDPYSIVWYEGTQYNEIQTCADCCWYDFGDNKPGEHEYVIEGELTTDGYATYDLSSIPPGIYFIDNYLGLIEIK